MSVLKLHSQLETSNRFPEIVTILQGGELECPDQPRPVAAVHRPRPGRAAPRLAAGPGSTEHSAYGIVTGLTEPATWRSRKDGRRNRYQIQAHLPLPEPASQPRSRLLIAGAVIVVVAVAWVAVQLLRPVPSMTLTASVTTVRVLPGTAPRPDWPGRAEAAVGLPGTGLLGTHGGSAPVPIASLAKIMTAYLVLAAIRCRPAPPAR